MAPTVSVLIPTYNRSGFLKKAITSVLAQSYTDYEIIVVDNCSTDDTAMVLAAFDDSRIKYHQNTRNIGAVHNYNRALRLATGRYVYLFSDDDMMLAGNLAQKVAVLEQHPQVGMVHSNLREINQDDIVTSDKHWAARNKEWQRLQQASLMAGSEAYEILYNDFNFISMPTVMVRKSLLDTQKLEFNNQLGYLVDWDLWLKLAACSDFYFIKEALVLYRSHGQNEYIKISQNIFYHELMLIKLSLIKPDSVEEHFEKTIALVAQSVKKQHHSIFESSPSALGVVRRLISRYVPAETKNKVRKLWRRG